MDDLKKLLTERLDKNLADYHAHLLDFEKDQIIDMASRIAAMSDTHMHLTEHYDFDRGELEFLLKFQNPLEVVANAWEVQRSDLGDMGFVTSQVCERQDALQEYPLTTDALPERENIHGYTILESTVFTNNRGFALAENPKAPSPFVTWQFTEENGQRDYYWGHYFDDKGKARDDLAARISDHKEQYGVSEKSERPVAEKLSIKDRLREAAKDVKAQPVKPPDTTKDEPR